ncbi:MAG: hypothetical protein WCK82_00600 [Bacteroidota bacterium]
MIDTLAPAFSTASSYNFSSSINKLSSKSFHYLFTHTIIKQLDNNPETVNAVVKDRTSTERYYKFDISKNLNQILGNL